MLGVRSELEWSLVRDQFHSGGGVEAGLARVQESEERNW